MVSQNPEIQRILITTPTASPATIASLRAAVVTICQPYMQSTGPQHTFCERVKRFLPEPFILVALPGVPVYNNLRSVRPLVVARKISGGTGDAQGSQTRLASLFGNWMAQYLTQSFPPLSGPADFVIHVLLSNLSPSGVTHQAELTSTTYRPRMV